MALVLMATMPWGQLWDKLGNAQVGETVVLKERGGATLITHYLDEAGTDPSTVGIPSDERGRLMRFVEEGSYDLLDRGETLPVEAVSGGTAVALAGKSDRDLAPLNVKNLGAVGDGNTHPLSGYFGSLAAAQVLYPLATSLTQEIDEVAIGEGVRLCIPATDPATTTRTATRALYIPGGTYVSLHGPLLALRSVMGLRVLTDGRQATKFRAMASMATVVDLNGVARCNFEGFTVESKGSGTDASVLVNIGVHLWWDNTGGSPTQAARSSVHNHFEQIEVNGCRCITGMQLGLDGTGNETYSTTINHPIFSGQRSFTKLNGAQTLPLATITVDSTGATSESYAFPTSGTLDVGGQTVTYTGVTGTTFTGCSGGSGLIADNAEVEGASLWQAGLKVGGGVSANNYVHSVNHFNSQLFRRGAHIASSGVEIHDGDMLNNEVGLYLEGVRAPVFIKGLRSETSKRLVACSGGTSVYAQVSLEDIRWVPNDIHSDGQWINFPLPGSLRLTNVSLPQDMTPIVPTIKADPTKKLTITIDGLASFQAKTTVLNVGVNVDVKMQGFRKLTGAIAVDTTGNTQGDYVVGHIATPRRVIVERSGRLDALSAGTRVLTNPALAPVATTGNAAQGIFYFDPADHDLSEEGYSTKLRLRLTALVNAVAPVSDFTIGMYPVATVLGAAATVSVTIGTVVSGSTAVVSAPAANSLSHAESTDFTPPAAGYYLIAIVNSAAMTASSALAAIATIATRHQS